ncbi:GM20219 [Drosophila sechellia]|uniref:GM20219 n=1 Tax=Drosophila sechellia TaxID=7238 RepID=B4HRA5_DROSE|nr:GM20219 [Drosophila sechellia]
MQYSSSSENYSSSLRDKPSKWGRNDKNYAYKKSSYQYSSSGDNNVSYQGKSPDQNIDQLDALLEDLKQERQITNRERDLLPSNGTTYRTLERTDPSGTVTRTTRVVKTSKHSGTGGQQPFIDDVETFSPTDYSTLQSTAKYSSLKRDEFQTKDKPYTLAHSPSGGHYESKSKIYESNRTINNNVELLPATSSTHQTLTSGTTIDKELQDIALGDGILPAPGSKVTTTLRTYTYDISATGPGSNTSTINRTHWLNNSNTLSSSYKHHESHNSCQNFSQLSPVPHPQPSHVPQTVVYNTESYSTLNRNSDRPVVSNQSYEIREHKETTTRGVSPQPRQLPLGSGPAGTPPGNRTVIYNIHKTDHVNTVNELPPQQRYPPRSPAHSPNYGGPHSPPLQPGLPPNNAYPQQPQNGNGYPPNSTTYSYKYSSTTNTNNRRGPDYGSPSPFPVDGVEYPVNSNPPQRVDDLMQSFGTTTDHVDRVDIETPVRKREIETAVASPNQQHVPSVNKAGKEVYYPPGHDTIVMKREEMHAGSASGGRWAKGSGMYEYESGSKSKTKTKSGGAVVPVCLPLCCAMPCTIM